MLNETVYEWVGINSHPMSWPAGTRPGLYKQIVVMYITGELAGAGPVAVAVGVSDR